MPRVGPERLPQGCERVGAEQPPAGGLRAQRQHHQRGCARPCEGLKSVAQELSVKAETLPSVHMEEAIEEDPRNAIVNELSLFEGTSDERGAWS